MAIRTKERKKDSQLHVANRVARRQQEGTMMDGFCGVLPSVASSDVTCPGQHRVGHEYPTRLELYDTVDQVGIILATWPEKIIHSSAVAR